MLEPAESAPVDAPTLLFVPLASSRIHLCAVSPATRFNAPGGSELMPSRLALAGEILASAWARTRDQGKSAVLGSSAPRSRASPVYARECLAPEHAIEGVIGQSDVLRYVLFKVDQVARTDATTLLLGETGTGKGLIARAIHERSARRNRPLITVNCAALPNGLVETELFGHEKGSYTGAHRSQAGRFEVADRGTILLDEIGDLPLEFQAKLLRILQEGELERVGSTKTLSVDVRVIAATNRDLEEDVREGRFREDLYYRLNVFPITLPPLRDRPEDIPLLVRHFVDRLSVKLGKPIERIPDAVMKDLQAHSWPGNVRELESVLTRALIVTSDTTLRLAHHFVPPSEVRNAPGTEMREVERTHISAMLSRHSWRIEGTRGAASALGMRPSTLRGRMRKLQIQRPR
jgi:transcriptional regulator with GAF, ATPase, and Fis domain